MNTDISNSKWRNTVVGTIIGWVTITSLFACFFSMAAIPDTAAAASCTAENAQSKTYTRYFASGGYATNNPGYSNKDVLDFDIEQKNYTGDKNGTWTIDNGDDIGYNNSVFGSTDSKSSSCSYNVVPSGDVTSDRGIWTTKPASYPTWTTIGTLTMTTTTKTTTKTTTGKATNCKDNNSSTTTVYTRDGSGNIVKATTKVPSGQGQTCGKVENGQLTQNGATKSSTTKTTSSKSKTVSHHMILVPFEYKPKTTVDKPKSKPGDTVVFTHTIAKTSGTPPPAVNPPTMTTLFERTGPTYTYNYNSIKTFLCKLAPSSCYQDSRKEVLPTYTGRTMSRTTTIKIGKDTPNGAKICYQTKVAPQNEKGGSTIDDDKACTTVGNETNAYNLVPSVRLKVESPAAAGEVASVSDMIENTMRDTSSEATWTAFAMKVESGADVNPITAGTHDDKTPQQLVDSLGKRPNGQPKAALITDNSEVNKTGKSTFAGSNTKSVGDRSYTLPDDSPVGTKYCFFLQVSPVGSASAAATRTSAAKCIVIGMKPKLNIYGGDLSVGRKFAGDTSTPNLLGSSIHTSLTVKNEDGKRKVYGSWTEYDAYAPGIVSGFGTASGLQGGLEVGTISQAQWSKLTFVNVKNTFGSFSSSNTLGTIPDTAAAVTSGFKLAQTIPADTTALDLGNSKTDLVSGIYKKDTGNLTLRGATLAPGKTAVVAVPDGTVTIDGDLRYGSGPYTSLTQVPQLLIIAKNIVIKSNVTNIDAWLIAKAPVGATAETSEPQGRITTCDTPGNLSVNVCNQPLALTGPIMSNQLVLRRTAGATDQNNDTPAERFNLRADSYLWIYQQGTSNSRAITTYNREMPVRF